MKLNRPHYIKKVKRMLLIYQSLQVLWKIEEYILYTSIRNLKMVIRTIVYTKMNYPKDNLILIPILNATCLREINSLRQESGIDMEQCL